MHVLISCKTTNLNVHGEAIRKKIAKGHLKAEHLARLENDHEQHHLCRQSLLALLRRKEISFVEVGRGLYWPDLKSVDAIITVGGDGTVLEASHHINDLNIPILGVRSSSMSVGHLCACDISDLEATIDALAGGSLQPKAVSRLKALIHFTETGGYMTTDPILNDFLYTNMNPAATTRYKISLGDQVELQKSSGIWLATAAGSTAAIAAAGGTPVAMNDLSYQFLVRELYAPRQASSLQKGFFDPDVTKFMIENHSEHAILALDGQHGHINLRFGDQISFLRASPLQLVWRQAL